MPPHPLTNFEVQKCYQNKPKFNGVYSRNNLSKIKDEAYIKNRIWIALYVNDNNMIVLELNNDYEKNDKILLKYFE